MFSFEEYLMGWGIYLFSVVGLLLVYWRMTRFIRWRYLRDSIRLFGAVFLLLPIAIEESSQYWAPAWIKALLNIVFSEMDAVWPIARLFLVALLATYLAYVVLLFISASVYKVRASNARDTKTPLDQERTEPHIS